MLSHPVFSSKCHFSAPEGSCFSSNSARCVFQNMLFYIFFLALYPIYRTHFPFRDLFSPVMPRILFTFSAFNTHYLRIYYYAFISFWHIQKKYSPFFSPFVSDSAVILPFYCTFFRQKPHFLLKQVYFMGFHRVYTQFIPPL